MGSTIPHSRRTPRISDHVEDSLRIPVATYRVQFNGAFTFRDAQAIVPYLHRLGISDLYASPIFKATRGSTHGYDVTDPLHLNPELGPEEAFEGLVRELKSRNMGLLLDIVPNHMAAREENPWWWDVLEKGPASPYAKFFDVDWHPPRSDLKNKVLLPLLGRPLAEVLERHELTLALDEGVPILRYHDRRFPLTVKSYRLIFPFSANEIESHLTNDIPAARELQNLLEELERMPPYDSPEARTRKWVLAHEDVKKRFKDLLERSQDVKDFVLYNIARFNDKRPRSQGFEMMERLLAQQPYRLEFWRTGIKEINYRRFFDIGDLIGLRVEDAEVFKTIHSLVIRLVREGKVTGLRIDHIDGLYDPLLYLRRLKRSLGIPNREDRRTPGFYILVEKIVLGDETLRRQWPVCGTTGYDFLNAVNGLFVEGSGVRALQTVYREFTGSQATFTDVVYEKKRQVAADLFPAEVHTLASHLHRLAGNDRRARHLSHQQLAEAIVEVTACLPVYRTYIRTTRVSPEDRRRITKAIDEAKQRNPSLDSQALAFLQRVLLLDMPPQLTREQRQDWLRFVMRWQQFTGPVMAKGLEDTAFYNYNALVSLNEVGGGPEDGALSVEVFHQRNLARRTGWPYTLNATSTHDTKRSEDVRARINVLSEMPGEWETCLARWRQWNLEFKPRVHGQPVPDPHMEVLLYQTLLGAWPLSPEEVPAFIERLKAYMVKAAREAKVHTSWLSPDVEYETALQTFIDAITNRAGTNPFLEDLLRLQRRVAFYGALNSLGQVLLKITSPGVPDFYQGTELWDFSLVDPDNRRPVDFDKRQRLLDDLQRREKAGLMPLIEELLSHWEDGRIKLFVTYKALNLRSLHRELFLHGDYIPCRITGERKEHVCAFARRRGHQWVVTAVPRHLTRITPAGIPPLGRRAWGDDALHLPKDAPQRWLNVFTGEELRSEKASRVIPLAEVFSKFPVALLMSVGRTYASK